MLKYVRMRNFILTVCCVLTLIVKAGDAVSIREGSIELPSYEISAPEKSPVFDCKWSYQRARRSIYPYALNDNLYAQKSEKKTWKALYLENEWVELCVLPEIGGRLFYAIDKTNGYDIFYRQDAIKPANVGMNGAWISGGVEWNVFHHHRISTQMPCNYRLVKNDDGSATIWLGETELRHRMEWAIGITLRPGLSCMEIDGRLVNCTEDSNSMLFWANVATHANPDYQIIFPQNTEFAAYHAKSSICHWPICKEPFTNVDAYTNNVDVSWWKNHTVGNSLFAWELPENFIGGYDHGQDAGTMLVGNRHIIRGGKFWSWGPNSGWPTKILTDARGHYVELMVGAYTDSQPDYNWSAPGETKVFKQYWYGVRNLKGIKMGDESAALNMEKTADGKLFLAVNGTRKLDLTVAVERGGEGNAVYMQGISVAPDRPWSTTIDADGAETDYTMLVIDSRTNRRILSYTPVKHNLSKPCPAEVKAPRRPKDIESTEECYYVGLRAEQFHQPYVDANDYYEEVLRRDPLDVRANTRLGVYYRKHWNLEKAEKHLRAALVRQTKDYTRVKDGEAMYNLGLVLAEKGDVEGAIDSLYRAVWTYEYNSAANLKLARIYAVKGDFKMALDRVNEAIDYNAHNLDALCLKATLLRLMVGGDLRAPREHENLLASILSFDPLNAYALYEKDGTMLSDDPEYALELALKFKANGFDAKCREILEAADRKGAYPGIKLHLGKIDEFLKMDFTAWRPFRRETKDALERLANEMGRRASCPSQARVWYALGNVYGNVDTAKAMSAWSRSIEQSNNRTILPYALRNLGYGHWKWTKDYEKALDFYRRAIAAKPDEAFFLEEFDHMAEEAKLPMAERYAMLKAHHETVEKRSGALTSEIVTGIACEDYDRILEILRTKYIPTFEGAANMHDTYVDALLLKGAELERAGDIKGAIALYEETENYPVNQQVFVELTKRRPRDAQVWHALGCAYEKLGEFAKAKDYFERAVTVDTLRTDYCYWKALCMKRLGCELEARAIGETMIGRGSVRLSDHVDFFDYEGNRYGATADARNADAAYTRGLGHLIVADAAAAGNDFAECLELKPDHLWAKRLLESLVSPIRVIRSISYEASLGKDGEGDLYLPEGAVRGVVLQIHGGGWSQMSRKDAAGISRRLCERGYAVFNVDYRLASPTAPWPCCGEDCVKAARFLLEGGLADHGVQPSAIWIMGASAGGHLALWTGFHLPKDKVQGVISVSGIADPIPDNAAHARRYETLFGGRRPNASELDAVSIMPYAKTPGPRILQTHAEEDSVVPIASARNFAESYRTVGGDVTFFAYLAKDEPNRGGHCIWPKGVKPARARLLALLENAIEDFMSTIPNQHNTKKGKSR